MANQGNEFHSFTEVNRNGNQRRNHEDKHQQVEGHEKMASLAGQFINLGLIGNTASDIYRVYENDSGDDKLQRKTIAFITLLSVSLLFQFLFTFITVWRFLYLRNRRAGDPDDDCCECARCPGCNCWRGTDQALFSISFILVTLVMILQVISSVVGAVGTLPK